MHYTYSIFDYNHSIDIYQSSGGLQSLHVNYDGIIPGHERSHTLQLDVYIGD